MIKVEHITKKFVRNLFAVIVMYKLSNYAIINPNI